MDFFFIRLKSNGTTDQNSDIWITISMFLSFNYPLFLQFDGHLGILSLLKSNSIQLMKNTNIFRFNISLFFLKTKM